MNEDGTPIVSDEPSTDNIPAADGGVTTTPEEVAKITGHPVLAPTDEEESDEEADEDTDESEESEDNDDSEESEEESNDDSDDDNGSDNSDAADEEEEKEDDKADDTADAPAFELEVEDANGTKFTLKPGDDLEKILEEFEPKSNGQIFAVLNQFNKLEQEKAKYDSDKAESEAKAAETAAIQKIEDGWSTEIKELQSQKRIPVTTDGKNERVDQVYEFLHKENDRRAEKGLPLLRTFEDALDKLELKELKDAETQKAKEAKELARKKGGIVGGSSAPASASGPVYKGGARTASEASRQMGLRK